MLLQERQKGKQIEKEIEVSDHSINKLTQQMQNTMLLQLIVVLSLI